MKKGLLCVCILFFANFALAKTVGKTSGTYGYKRSSSSQVSSGTFLSGRTGGYYAPVYYHNRGTTSCSGSNRACGRDADDGKETERLYSFREGTCISHGCKSITVEADCTSAASAVKDTSGVASLSGTSNCPSDSKCYYSSSDNDVKWCATGSSDNQCTSSSECLCWCLIGTEDSSVDVGLILGITFGLLFGCCILVGVWMHCAKQARLKKQQQQWS